MHHTKRFIEITTSAVNDSLTWTTSAALDVDEANDPNIVGYTRKLAQLLSMNPHAGYEISLTLPDAVSGKKLVIRGVLCDYDALINAATSPYTKGSIGALHVKHRDQVCRVRSVFPVFNVTLK